MVRVAVLGAVRIDERPVVSQRMRRVLAALALERGSVVTGQTLASAVWSGDAPATAAKALQNVVVELRKLLGSSAVETSGDGYRLCLVPEDVDAWAFATAAADVALELWGGVPFADLDWWPPAHAARTRLEARRLDLLESKLAAAIEQGRSDEAIIELSALVDEHPFRERLPELLAVAQYRAGRQADALATLRRSRRIMRDELGLDPTPKLAALEQSILIHRTELISGRLSWPLPPTLAALRDPRWRFCGRTDEIGVLHDRWVRTKGGRGAVTALVAHAGTGKSRLAAEFAAEVAGASIVLYGRFAQLPTSTFEAVGDALRTWCSYAADEVPLPPALGLVAPDIVHGSLPFAEDPMLVFEAVAQWLLRVAAVDPVLFVVDDVQWASPSNATMLRHIARRIEGSRIHVLMTARPEPSAQDLLSGCRADVIDLTDLDEESVVSMLSGGLDREQALMIWHASRGNPFLTTSAAMHVLHHGALGLSSDAAWSLRARIERLGPDAVELLTFAAVIGQQFDLMTVSAAAGADESAAADVFEAAQNSGLLIELGVERWAFQHDLVRAFLLEQVSALRLAQHHRAAANTIELLRPTDLNAIAHHYEAAGPRLRRKAGEYLAAAGVVALDVGAFSDALDLLLRAQRAGASDAAFLVRLAQARAGLADPSWVETALEAALLAMAQHDHRSLIDAALVTAQWTDGTGGLVVHWPRVDIIRQALDVAELPADRALLLAAWADELRSDPDDENRQTICRQSIAQLDAAGVVSDLVAARVLSVVAEAMGPAHVPERHVVVDRLLVVADRSHDPMVTMRASWAGASMAIRCADRHAVDTWLNNLANSVEQDRAERGLWNLTLLRAVIAVADGDFAGGEELLNESLRVGTAMGRSDAATLYFVSLMNLRIFQQRVGELLPMLRPMFATPAGRSIAPMVLALVGEHDEATRLLDELVAAGPTALAGGALQLPLLRCWATAAWLVGHRDAASLLYDEMLPLAGYLGHEGPVTAAGDQYLGMLATTLQRWDDAERWLTHALQLATRFGASLLMLDARLMLVELHLARHRPPLLDDRVAEELLAIDEAARTMGAAFLTDRVVACRTVC